MDDSKKNVSIPLTEFQQLMKNVKDLTAKVAQMEGQSGGVYKAPSAKERTATVSFVNGKPVIGYVNRGTTTKPMYVYEAPDPQNPRDRKLYVDLILEGQKDPVKVGYMEFMTEAEHKECLIVKIDKDAWEQTQGVTEKKEVPEGEYYMTASGIVVPVEIKGEIRWYTLRMADGKEIKLHERYVNINK